MKKLYTLLWLVTFAFISQAQNLVTIPSANPVGTTDRRPLASWWGYERSAMIYQSSEINSSGSVTSVGFYIEKNVLPAGTVIPIKVYMKTTTATTLSSSTVAAEQTGATLVFDAPVTMGGQPVNSWVTLNLTSPFQYSGADNLEIIIEANYGGTGVGGSTDLYFRHSPAGGNRFQYWSADNTAPTGTGSTSASRPNVQLGFAASQPNDVAVTAITTPTSGCGHSAQEDICITVANYGTASQSNIPVSYTLNNGTPVSAVIAGPLASGTTVNFCFPVKANMSMPGTYTITAQTSLTGDANAANDSKSKTVNSIPSISTYPYNQDFEAGAGGWIATGALSTWALGTPAKTVINSAASGTKAWITGLTTAYNTDEKSEVTSPCFNMSSLVQPIISMKIWWETELSYDGAVLQSSKDGGLTWQNVGALGDPNNWYNDNSISGNPGGQQIGWSGEGATGSGGWVVATHKLTALGGQSSVMFRIGFGADGSQERDGVAFDDVSIYESPANDLKLNAFTSPVLNASTCGFTATETVCISVTNEGTTPATNFPISYQIGNGTVVTETANVTIAPGATDTICFNTKANLAAGGNYSFSGTVSLANDAVAFNNTATANITNPLIATFPHIQDFETGTVGSPGKLPAGWFTESNPGTSTYKWFVNAGSTSSSLTGPTADHTSGTSTGKYVYTEASNGSGGNETYLTSPCVNLAGLNTPGVEFWYHMAGPGMGTMDVQISSDNGATWTTLHTFTGPQQAAESDPWLKRAIDLTAYSGNIRIRFKGTKSTSPANGYDYEGDMAIDDVKFFNIGAVDLGITAFKPLTKICGFGNNEPVEVTIENFGGLTATSFNMSYSVNNGPFVTQAYTGSLPANSPTTFTFTQGADLSAPSQHVIKVAITGNGDPNSTNDTIVYTINNAAYASIPPIINFESATTGISAIRGINGSKATLTEDASASLGTGSTKGLIMAGVTNSGWVIPVATTNPWTNNPDNFAAAYLCFNAAGASVNDPLWLSFDLKQLYKGANANTNFRVTVNGTPVGGNQATPANTYRPPFSGTGGTTNWTKVYIDLSDYNGQSIQIGFESSVSEEYANGTGTANMIDNIRIQRLNPTGTATDVLASQLKVYPNPSAGLFSVTLPQGKAFEMEVTDLTGKVILKQAAKANGAKIDLSKAAKGVYLLKVNGENGTATRKLIVE